MDKQLFDDVIGEVPPSTVDVEAVITRGRRADRVRQVANPVVAAGVAVVLGIGVVAYTMTRDDGGGGGIRAGGPTSTASPSAPPSTSSSPTTKGPTGTMPEQCSRPDVETPAAVIARLDPVLGTLFHGQLPNGQFVANPENQYPDGVLHGPLELFQVTGETPVEKPVCDVDSYFMTRATVQLPDGTGNVLVLLAPAYDHGDFTDQCDPPGNGGEQTYCEVVDGPHGETILRQTRALEGGTTMNRVDITRADGTSVIVESANIGTDVRTGGAPTIATPPLTVDQVAAIGIDPGLTLFP
jgi:hypothetical protein